MLNLIFFAALAAYFAATLLQFIAAVFKKDGPGKAAWYVFVLAFALNSLYLVARGVVAGRLPLSNQFEFSTAFAWGVALLYAILHLRWKADWMGVVAMPAAFLVLSYAALLPKDISELMPALRSAWFGLHIGSAVFSYAAFALAGCVGVMYLVREKKGWSESKLLQMDHLSYRLVALGFLLLTVVILSGCVWAEQAWSSFWSWDPKETWALITWIFYAIYLHQRIRREWRGRRMAWYAIIAVAFVIFTFVGVNTLLPGLHSYG